MAYLALLRVLSDTRRSVFVHHSSLSAQARELAEVGFHRSPRAVCFATNTLEVGIDIGDVDLVGLFGPPGSVSAFIQRAGRSNRRESRTRVLGWYRQFDIAGRRRDEYIDLRRFLALAAAVCRSESDGQLPGRHYGVAAQQVMSLLRRLGGRLSLALLDVVGQQMNASWLRPEDTRDLLMALTAARIVRAVPNGRGDYDADDIFYELVERRAVFSNIGGALGRQVEGGRSR